MILDPKDFVAHTDREGGEWLKGYGENWIAAVLNSGRVYDRVYEQRTGKLYRETFDSERLKDISRVVHEPKEPCNGAI